MRLSPCISIPLTRGSELLGNVMLIARQKPDATNVAGIRTWNSLGRFVKRGEKGILILAPMVGKHRKTGDAEQAEDANETESKLSGFRAVYVFDRLSRELRPSLCALDGFPECHFREPLDSRKHIIAQLPCPAQRSLMQRFQLSPSFAH